MMRNTLLFQTARRLVSLLGVSRRRLWPEVLLAALPLALSLGLAFGLSQRELQQRADLVTELLVERTAQITTQVSDALKAMHVYAPAKACSASSIDFMRSIDLSSSLLQGVGFIARDALQCSSLGSVPTHVGSPDFVTPNNRYVRRNRTLAEARRTELLLVSDEDGYTVLIHPALLFSSGRSEASAGEGLISAATRDLIAQRGEALLDWSVATLGEDSGVWRQGDWIVAWQRVPDWDFVAYSTAASSHVGKIFTSMIALLGPMGLVCSFICVAMSRRLASAKASLATQLREGLRRGEVVVVYQPIVHLATSAWVGAEVLARWRRPGGEWISPDLFVPIAERNGLIRDLTRVVVAQTASDFAAYFGKKEGFFLSINVCATDLAAPEFPKEIARVLAENGVPAELIHLEVTERAEVKLEAELEGIAALRQQGLQIGIDDFGVGYSNLAYMNRLPIDYIKIDRAFVADLVSGHVGASVVDHLIDIAHERKLVVVAEGIETIEQVAALQARGVAYGQGWLFAKPMPAAELATALYQSRGGDFAGTDTVAA